MGTPHTSTRKNKTVFIILKDGTKFEDKFLDKKSGCIFLKNHGKIDIKDLKSFGIRKLK